jgi:hypothetical protein
MEMVPTNGPPILVKFPDLLEDASYFSFSVR